MKVPDAQAGAVPELLAGDGTGTGCQALPGRPHGDPQPLQLPNSLHL